MNNSDLAKILNITPEKLKRRAAALGIRTGGRGSTMSKDEIELITETKDYSLNELRVYKDCLMSKFKNPELFKEFLQKQYNSEAIESMVNAAMSKNTKNLRRELQKWYRDREKLFKQEISGKVDKLQENFTNAQNSTLVAGNSDINYIISKIKPFSEKLVKENSEELEQELKNWFMDKEKSYTDKIEDLAKELRSNLKAFKGELSKPSEDHDQLIIDFFEGYDEKIDQLKADMKEIIKSEESKEEIKKIINNTLEKRRIQEIENELKERETELTLIKQKSINIKGFSLFISLERFRTSLEKEHGLFFDDEIYEDCWSGIQDGKPLLLIGAPGTGKTELGNKLSCVYDIFTQYEIARDDWSAYTMNGGMWITSKGKDFVPEFGFFSNAVFKCIEKEGKHWLFIDELNQCNIDIVFGDIKDVLNVGFNEGAPLPHTYLSSFLNGKFAGIKIPTTFRFICAMNYFDSHLFNSMSASLMRRFKVVYIHPPSIEIERKIVEFHVLNKNNYRSFEKGRRIKLDKVIEDALELINEIRSIGKQNMCKESEIGADYTIKFCTHLGRSCDLSPWDRIIKSSED